MKPTVVGCTRVKDGVRYIERWVQDMLRVCDTLCVLDDGSTDGTTDILRTWSRKDPRMFVRYQRGLERHGGRDYNALYDMAVMLQPRWILAPDVDEFIHPEDFEAFKELPKCDRPDVLGWTFPFFYLWDREDQYRADGDYRNCHVIRMFQPQKGMRPPSRMAHAQMCPDELNRNLLRPAPVRMVHYGYMDAADRQRKYEFYTNRDSDPLKAGAGVRSYEHILGANAVLKKVPSRSEWLMDYHRLLTHMSPEAQQAISVIPK